MGERTLGPWAAYHDYKTTWGVKIATTSLSATD